VKAGRRRIALVAPTFSDVREVMVSGPSGFLNIGEDEDRPRYEASRHRLVWPDGAMAYGFSSEDPDGLRGPQFDCAWADEFAAWTRPQETLDMLGLGLRLGEQPQLMITTTPRPLPALKALLKQAGVVISHAADRCERAQSGAGVSSRRWPNAMAPAVWRDRSLRAC
jgi:phage terminase large subunit-like protein